MTRSRTHYNANNNFALDQVSAFLGGGIGEHTGGFVQFTYSNIPNASKPRQHRPAPIHDDIRPRRQRAAHRHHHQQQSDGAGPVQLDLCLGLSLRASGLAPSPAATPILDGAFAGNSIGYTAYAWYDKSLYLEAGIYTTMGTWMLARLGNDFGVGQFARRHALSAGGL